MRRSNGFEVSSMKRRKPTLTSPITPSTRATISSGRWRLNDGHRHRPHGQHQHPQQERSLVRAPRRREAVGQRQLRVGVGRDVEHRKIVVHEGPREAAECDRDEYELALRERARGGHPRLQAARGPRERHRALREREQQREDQRELTNFGDHLDSSLAVLIAGPASSAPSAPAPSRGRPPAACSSRRASRAPRSR